MAKQTDNHNPAAKLALRKYFLEKYHADGSADVIDCCQGGGVLWSEIRTTHSIRSYWGLDLKPKKGRLKLDSVRVISQSGWPQNVVDVDTYGSPWKHWLALLPNVTRPVTVFLTLATIKIAGGGSITNEEKHIIGFDKLPSLPTTFESRVSQYATELLLSQAVAFARIIEAVEAISDGNARYIGVRLEPKQTRPGGMNSEPQHNSALGSKSHV